MASPHHPAAQIWLAKPSARQGRNPWEHAVAGVLLLSVKPPAPHTPPGCCLHSKHPDPPGSALSHQTPGAKTHEVDAAEASDPEHPVRPQGFLSPRIQHSEGMSRAGSQGYPISFPITQPSPWGKGRLDKTSPFCSTKLVSQRHWAYNYYFPKDEPRSYRQKSPLLSELEFDVLTTVFVPRLLEERARQEGEREI